MKIAALPESTVRLLGSSPKITTPVALVKELLDNALDARATCVEVLISPNTIDSIQVRDNGTGIHPDDYGALARRGHTSKLKAFEELRTLGGTTLGFRGEALASANALANIKITTKTDSDAVAAILEIASLTGGILKQEKAAAPVGTTVAIKGLYSQVPVRRQFALKESTKSLDKIKELLRSYAMARPQVKLIFKVAGTARLNWSYSPSRTPGIKEAVLQVFGTETASQCFERTLKLPRSHQSDLFLGPQEYNSDDHYVFETFIVKPDLESPHLPKHRFFSVDGRPISPSGGTMKKLASIYLKLLKNAIGASVQGLSVSDVFIVLNIECPVGSYDPNIEPSKSDVLFADEAAVIYHFEELCSGVYGPLKETRANEKDAQRSADIDVRGGSGVKPTGSSISAEARLEDHIVEDITSTPEPRAGRATDTTELSRTPNSRPDEGQGMPSVDTDNNPWAQTLGGRSTPAPLSWTADSSLASRFPESESRITPEDQHLLSQQGWTSNMAAEHSEQAGDRQGSNRRAKNSQRPVHNKRKPHHAGVSSAPEIEPSSIPERDVYEEQNHAKFSQPMQGLTGHMYRPLALLSTPEPELGILRHRGAPPADLDIPPSLRHVQMQGGQNNVPGGAYRSPLPSSPMNSSSPLLLPQGNRQFKPLSRRLAQPPWSPPSSSPRDQGQLTTYESGRGQQPYGLKQTTISFNGPRGIRTNRQGRLSDGPANDQQTEGSDPQSHHDHGRSQGEFSSAKNPGQQFSYSQGLADVSKACQVRPEPSTRTLIQPRLQAFVGNDSEIAEEREPIQTSIPKGDPRAYLLRRQKSKAAEECSGGPKKLRRLRSNLLPLENTPVQEQIHSLVLPMNLDMHDIPKFVELFERFDKYIVDGDVEEGLDIELGESRIIEGRLNKLLACWQERLTGERNEVESGLCAQLKGKGSVRVG